MRLMHASNVGSGSKARTAERVAINLGNKPEVSFAETRKRRIRIAIGWCRFNGGSQRASTVK